MEEKSTNIKLMCGIKALRRVGKKQKQIKID